MKLSTTKKLAAAAAATALLLTSACGSGDDGGDGGLTQVTVGILPTVDLAPLQYAIDEGLFEEHGLEVTTRVTSGGAEAIPALMAGDVDFIFTSYIPVLLARQADLDVVIASGSHSNTPGEASPSGVWVSGDSPAQSLADLEGATIAVNSLGSVAELLVVAAMDSIGVGRDDFDLLEIPFPDVPAALDQGRVDATWVAEPSRSTIIKNLSARFVGSPDDPAVLSAAAELQDVPMAGYAARGSEDAGLLEAFHSAMDEALGVLADDPGIARELAPEYTEIDAELLPDLAVSTFGPVEAADLERLQDLMVTYGLLDEPLEDIDEIVYQP
ncbi:ABC transporter substrate-binding protein [Jiangella endophytica]|uniref:ABC transporter substrate-binding protein n=1 Tax=Jiangella endophytica TaxID=1623398 RepID=UPI000E3521AE|nr:ABC transporter substrate-binding protein [Jiangella endophytica]